MHDMLACFNEKFSMSFSQMVCMLYMMVYIKETLPYRPDLCCMSPFTVFAYKYSFLFISNKYGIGDNDDVTGVDAN
jgi:hypothetical protein